MAEGYIEQATLDALHEARDAMMLRVERFTQQTPVDAHAKFSVPASALGMLGNLSFFAVEGKVPASRVEEYLTAFENSYKHRRNAHSLAKDISQWLRGELHLSITTDAPPMEKLGFVERETITSLNRFYENSRLLTSRSKEKALLSHTEMSDVLTPISIKILSLCAQNNCFKMTEEEKEVLSRELVEFMVTPAYTSDAERNKKPVARPAYRTRVEGVEGEKLEQAYHYMRGCGGSVGYRNAVDTIFKQLADALNERIARPSLSR